MEGIQLGLRVVRGPNWEYNNVDGGEGHVGTVVLVEESLPGGGMPVIVQWDSGSRCRCRCGVDGKYDLRVLDSAPAGRSTVRIQSVATDYSQILYTFYESVYQLS